MLGIPFESEDILLKYIGGLHNYLKHTFLMFDPTELDKVSVQDTHLEERGKFGRYENKKHASNNNSYENNKEKGKYKGKLHLQFKKKIPKMYALIVRKKVI